MKAQKQQVRSKKQLINEHQTLSLHTYSDALIHSELTNDERQRMSQPFNNYGWIRSGAKSQEQIQFITEMTLQDATRLAAMQSILNRFHPQYERLY